MSLDTLDASSNEEKKEGNLMGYVRVVSEVEAGIALRDGQFLSSEVFEVWDGYLPPNVWAIDTSWFGYNEYFDYRRVLFVPIDVIATNPDVFRVVSKHPNYRRKEYPAVELDGIYNTTELLGKIRDITQEVRNQMNVRLGKRLSPEQIISLSNQPIDL